MMELVPNGPPEEQECRTCGAKPLEQCKTMSGKNKGSVRLPHSDRYIKAHQAARARRQEELEAQARESHEAHVKELFEQARLILELPPARAERHIVNLLLSEEHLLDTARRVCDLAVRTYREPLPQDEALDAIQRMTRPYLMAAAPATSPEPEL